MTQRLTPEDAKKVRAYISARVAVAADSGCWVWTGYYGPKNKGYGSANFAGKRHAAHRLAYLAFVGPIEPLEDDQRVFVCHRCDLPRCCNPDHLFLGTHEVNMDDRNAKRRQAVGSRAGRAKLTEAQVAEIRRLRGVFLNRELAARYGVSDVVISAVHRRKIWRHVP